MKRMIAILLAVLMLTGILTACSGTLGMSDGRAYGNVSTSPNGTVNGGSSYNNNTAQQYNSKDYANNRSSRSYQDNAYPFEAKSNSGTGVVGGR